MIEMLGGLAIVVDGRWRPGIGDPTLGGWLTVAAYLAAVVICWRAAELARQARCMGGRTDAPLFWLGLAAGLLVFVVVRAASFHHVDVFLGAAAGFGTTCNVVLEVGATTIIAVAGILACRRAVHDRDDPGSEDPDT